MPSRRLVVCCDGTWNKPDQKGGPTNVVKLLRALKPTDRHGMPQVMFYDMGVGTSGNWLDRCLGGALGLGLNENVRQAYGFIADNYDRDRRDDLFFFGFSRGAFTVRSLAGFIGAVGLLPKCCMHRFEDAWNCYRVPPERRPAVKEKLLRELLPHKPLQVKINFIGVWDTVGTLGIPFGPLRWVGRPEFRFHNTNLGSNVERACQALAIDERRRSFQPAIWKQRSGAEFEQELQAHAISKQVLNQTWFAGAHSNVGGGYPDCALSDIALAWMIRKAELAGLGVDEGYLNEIQARGTRQLLVNSRSWKWWLRLPFERALCSTESEWIHHSVTTRMDYRNGECDPCPYQPANVIRLKKSRREAFSSLIDRDDEPRTLDEVFDHLDTIPA